MGDVDFTKVLREWQYIYNQYSHELPFLTLLYNCSDRRSATITAMNFGADSSGQFIKLTTREHGDMVVSPTSVWGLRAGKTNKGTTIFTHEI